jgi:hypothetical protein
MGISLHEDATMEVKDKGKTVFSCDGEQSTYPLLAVSCLTYSAILKMETT